MAKRHKKAEGGKVEEYTPDVNVEKEAKERKRGGKVEGKMSKMRLDRPGRKMGGRVGSDKSPLTSAARVTPVMGHSTDD